MAVYLLPVNGKHSDSSWLRITQPLFFNIGSVLICHNVYGFFTKAKLFSFPFV